MEAQTETPAIFLILIFPPKLKKKKVTAVVKISSKIYLKECPLYHLFYITNDFSCVVGRGCLL